MPVSVYADGADECELHCRSRDPQGQTILLSAKHVDDGTPCLGEQLGQLAVCIEGTCQVLPPFINESQRVTVHGKVVFALSYHEVSAVGLFYCSDCIAIVANWLQQVARLRTAV